MTKLASGRLQIAVKSCAAREIAHRATADHDARAQERYTSLMATDTLTIYESMLMAEVCQGLWSARGATSPWPIEFVDAVVFLEVTLNNWLQRSSHISILAARVIIATCALKNIRNSSDTQTAKRIQ
ncbi:hypothetical protein EVAR_50489_1 [Eumeta japonica]|uniref:Uncharacterized protein n=1 Tax=Eumeta variegata TaxID=151549 RepID=A0A4C1XVM3_EUMVA|nr:hypothetical protein EVAR_50489_1 [Eumeta japonica]